MINAPTSFSPDLTDDRLNAIAHLLLDARYSALNDASTELDDRYTQGCLAFGRQRQAIIRAWNNNLHPWLSVAHAGSDLVFRIGTVMVRFFTDNSSRPKKQAILIPTQAESVQLNIFEPNSSEVVLWRFIVEPALNDDDQDIVYFIGINAFNEILCKWKCGDFVPVLHSIDSSTPAAKELPSASIYPKTENEVAKQDQNNVQR